MAKSRQQKEETLGALKKNLGGAESIVFVGFNALKVGEATELRARLRKGGVRYQVAKKSLVGKAMEGANVEGKMPELSKEYQLALAWGADPVAPAKGIAEFAKTHTRQVYILGGIYEGKFMDSLAMKEIASIPGLDILRGMFVNLINSPIQGLVVALNAIASKKV